MKIKHYETVKDPEQTVLNGNLDGLLVKKGGAYVLTLQNNDPSTAKSLQMKVKQAIAAESTQQLAEQIKAQAKTLQGVQKIIALQNEAQHILIKQVPAQSPAFGKVQQLEEQAERTKRVLQAPVKVAFSKPDVSAKYVYGNSYTVYFDVLSPILVGFFVFFFVFLISGIGLLKERTSGTLDRLMATPVKRGEIVAAYLAGFGIFAVIQTVIVVFYAVNVLDMVLAGSLWNVLLVNLMLALVALSLGILLSSFAASEFQMVQFIPLVVVPQIFFSGIIPLKGMAVWLQALAKVMPIYYGADALKRVMYEGMGLGDVWKDLTALVVFAVIFILLNIVALRRYRAL